MLTLQKNISLKPYNTFGIEAKADFYVEIHSLEDIKEIYENEIYKNYDKLILGGGSNILLTQDFKGLVLKMNIKGITSTIIEDDIFVTAGAGEIWHDFVLHTLENNWYGLENLSLIPGTVGAAPMQNIGAYGVEITDVFQKLEAYDIETGQIHTFSKEQCEFGYRWSVFKGELKNRYIILKVTFKLHKMGCIKSEYGAINDVLAQKSIENPTPQDISNAVIEIRSSKLPNPKEIGNAGSFFKNPVISTTQFSALQKIHPHIVGYTVSETETKVPAGWLIEQAGWKGKTFGDIGVHKNQALVLVNYKNGKGEDIKALAFQIKDDVFTKFGIEIEPEVNFI